MDEQVPTNGFHHIADRATRRVIRRDGGTNGNSAASRDLGCHETEALDVQVAMRLREPELARQMAAHDVAVEQRDLPVASLEKPHEQGVRDGGFARARQAGEENREPLSASWR